METDKTLDLVEKLKQKSISPLVHAVGNGKRLSAPVVVDLDPTTFCDLACPECISSGVINKGQFDKDRVVSLAKELALSGVKAVVLIGGGEPLMHKSIGTVIEILYRSGLQIGLVSNGTLIHRYIEPLAEMISWVRISMDAGSQEVYDSYRPSGRKQSVYPTVIENMRLLGKRKKGTLGYSYLLMFRLDEDGQLIESNYHDVLNGARVAKDVGCDYFEVKAMYDDDHQVMVPPAELYFAFEAMLPELRELETDDFHVLHSSTYDALSSTVRRKQIKEYTHCPVMEMRTTITPSGVFACPSHRGNPDGYLGDVSQQTFQHFWENLDTHKVNPQEHCKFFCPRHESNNAIIKMKNIEEMPENIDDFNFFI